MGAFKQPKAPPPPDPYAVGAAQTNSNVNTAVANSYIGNADERGPLGSVDYDVSGYHSISDGHGGTIQVPSFSRTQTLSPNQQTLLQGQEQAGIKANDIAGGELDYLKRSLGQPFNTQGLPRAPRAPTLRQTSGNDYSADRLRVEQAMLERARPEMEGARRADEARLAAQGINLGSEAYRAGQDDTGRRENDFRLATILAGGQEQSRLHGEERADIGVDNSARTGMYTMGQNAHERAFQERMAMRNQPINEIGALLSQGQVSMPQFAAYRGGDVAPTNVGGYVYNSAGLAQDAYNTKSAAMASDRKGLYDLAGKAAGGFMRYGMPG